MTVKNKVFKVNALLNGTTEGVCALQMDLVDDLAGCLFLYPYCLFQGQMMNTLKK